MHAPHMHALHAYAIFSTKTCSSARTWDAGAPVVQLEGVTICTPTFSRTLVEGLNVSLAPGGSLLVMGPSGCGKTSLLRAIGGLWTSGSGSITRPSPAALQVPPSPIVPCLPVASGRRLWHRHYKAIRCCVSRAFFAAVHHPHEGTLLVISRIGGCRGSACGQMSRSMHLLPCVLTHGHHACRATSPPPPA